MIGMTLIRGLGWPFCIFGPTSIFRAAIRKKMSSLALGNDGFFGAGSEGFVVAALNAASAACRGSLVLRVLSTAIDHPYYIAL
jgi:hypothetical protein